MYRRRRPHREIEFSFDSFLDVVANVVGIILRLILIAWVAGRGYQYVVPPPAPLPEMSQPEELPEPTVERPATFTLTREQIERERVQEQAKMAEVVAVRERERAEEARIAEAAETRSRLAAQEAGLAKAGAGVSARLKATKLTTAELEERSKNLLADLEAVRKLPPKRKELRYHTPVAAEVQTEEVMFECRSGRVTLLDTSSLLAKAKNAARERVKELETAWEFTGTTPPVGSFRLRYVVERERTPLDGFGSAPVGNSFRYGFTSWEAVPTSPARGEEMEEALAAGSVFRRITDAIDPKETVVTLWVYPDSFPLYRKLRDHLHEKEIVVAGRPLPEGSPIASSRHGTTSRGQ
jgi:hypothetical protein